MDGSGESRVVYAERNVKKFNKGVGSSAGEFKGRTEGLDEREERSQ